MDVSEKQVIGEDSKIWRAEKKKITQSRKTADDVINNTRRTDDTYQENLGCQSGYYQCFFYT